MDDAPSAAAREISPELAAPLLGYLEVALGREAVIEALEEVPGRPSIDTILAPDRWMSVEQFDALIAQAERLTGDEGFGRDVGITSYRALVGNSAGESLRSTGSVVAAIATMADYASKMTVVRRLQVVEEGRRHALLEGRCVDGAESNRFGCDTVRGFFGMLPGLFDMFGTAVEVECERRGDPRCLYRIAWSADPGSDAALDQPMVRGLTQVEQLESYHESATHLVEASGVTDVLERIVRQVSSTVKAPAFLLWVVLEGETEPRVHHLGLSPADVDGLLATLRNRGRPPREAVIAEVEHAGATIGQLVALLPPGTTATATERRTLRSYAHYATAALEIVAALEDARTSRDTATALLGLARSLADAADVDSAARELAVNLPTAVGCDVGSVWRFDERTEELRLLHAVDPAGRPVALGIDVLTTDRPRLRVLSERHRAHIVRTEELEEDGRALMGSEGLAEVALLPIVTHGTLFGMASAGFREPLSSERRRIVTERVQGMADQTAVAFENAHLLDQLRHRAMHDDLTGLPNRALAEDRCAHALASRSRHGGTVAVLFVDLDDFKAVNDSFGHAAGDELLRQIAERLRSGLRSTDTCARLGGDEFVLVLPDVGSAAEAEDVARRVGTLLDEPFSLGGSEVRVTASVGVSTATSDDTTFEDLLQRSDAAMYRVKRSQRGGDAGEAWPSSIAARTRAPVSAISAEDA